VITISNIIRRLKELLSQTTPDLAITQLSAELQLDTQKTLEIVQKTVDTYIRTKLLRAITNELESSKPPLEKINVTDLTFPCLRYSYYAKKYHTERRGRLPELLAMWIGVKLHETKILRHSELELEYNGVYGRVDEYEDEVILEIKTTRNIPSKPYPHHIKQVSYYRVLLEKNGYPVRFAVILYINVSTLEAKSYIVLFEQSLEEVEREMLERKTKLEKALSENKVPPPEPDEPWACDYCSFAYLCGLEME